MSVAVELWRAVERWNPLQKRAADGTWGDGAGRFRGDSGVVHLDRDEDGNLSLGIGSAAFGEARDEDDDSSDVFGHTARLSPAAVRELHGRLSAAAAEGKRRQVVADRQWEEHATVPDHGDDFEIASGYVSGEGADVHYSVILDDYSVGVQTYLAAVSHTSDATLDDLWGAEQAAEFDAAEMRKLLARLATAAGTTESAALDLWRALEARHSLRGPDGRFIPAGGGGSARPSLADVVRGTAALGPKRQRPDRGGMTVADAVRSAARRSDSTGRPTQRTPEQHRAAGGHAVADEVDRALAEAGVPEDVRRMVAERARVAADAQGGGAAPPPKPKPVRRPEPPAPAGASTPRNPHDVIMGLDFNRTAQASDTPPAHELARLNDGTLQNMARSAPGSPMALAAQAELDRRGGTPAPAEPKLTPSEEADLREERTDVMEQLNDLGDRDTSGRAAKLRARLAEINRTMVDNGIDVSTPKRFGSRSSVPRPAVEQPPVKSWQPTYTRQAPAAPRSFATPPVVARQDPEKAARMKAEFERQQEESRKANLARAALRVAEPTPPSSPREAAPPAKPKRTPARLGDDQIAAISVQLGSATSRDEARQNLAGLTVPQLRQVAEHSGVALGSGDTKARALDRIVNSVVGRRLDSAAINRMTNR